MSIDGITKATFQKVYTVSAAEALRPQLDTFVALKAFPFVKVDGPNGNYNTFNARDFQTDEIVERNPGSEYKRTKSNYGNNSFLTTDYGLEEAIDDRERQIVPVSVEQDIADKFMLNGMRRYERYAYANLFAAGAGTTKTGGADFTKWLSSGGDPINNMWAFKKVVKDKIGVNPDSLLLSEDVYLELVNHSDIIGRLPDNQLRTVKLAVLKELFGIQNIEVMEAVTNASKEGDANQAPSQIATDKALLYLKGGNTIGSAGYAKILYEDMAQGTTSNGIGIFKYREEKIKSDVIRVEQFFTHILQSADAALLLDDVI